MRVKTEFLKNRTGDKPHSGRARSARNTAKTVGGLFGRPSKSLSKIGKSALGANLQPRSNFFLKKTFEKVSASAPLPPANFEEVCGPKQKNFPFHFEEKIGARKIKKVWENFSVLEFVLANGESGAIHFCIFSLFVSLAVLDPNPPIRGRQQGTPKFVKNGLK